MRVLKITSFSVLALLLLLVGGAALFLVTLDPEDHKERITSLIREQSGLELQLAGPMELTLYPWLGLTVSDVSVVAGSDDPFLRVEHARARARLLPLFTGQYEIDTVRIRGARADLVIDEEGRGNWQVPSATTEAPEVPQPEALRWPAALALGGVDVSDTRITLDDRREDRLITLNDVTVRTGELSYGEPIEVHVSVDATSNRPELRARTTLDGRVMYSDDGRVYDIAPLTVDSLLSGPAVPGGETEMRLSAPTQIDLGADTLMMEALELDGAGVELSAMLTARGINTEIPAGTLDLDMTGDDMAMLFRIAGQEELAGRIDSLGDRGFSLAAEVEADGNTQALNIRDLRASLLGARIETSLALDGTGLLNGRIQAEGPDLPLLMTLAGQLQGNDGEVLRGLGQQLSIMEDRAFSTRAGFDINIEDGRMDIPDMSIRALGIRADGSLAASGLQSDAASIDGNLDMTGEELPPLLRALGQDAMADSWHSFTLSSQVSGQGGALTAGPFDMELQLSDPALPDGTLGLRLQAQAERNVAEDSFNVPYFTLSGGGLDLDGRLAVAAMSSEEPRFQGQLYAGDTDLRAVADRLGFELPATRDPSVLSTVGFEVEFAGSAGQLSTRSLRLTLDDSTLDGSLTVDRGQSPVDIDLSLNLDQMNVDRYLSPRSQSGASPTEAPSIALLPLAITRLGNTSGSLDVGRLDVGGMRLDQLHVSFGGSGDQLTLAPMETLLYGGRFDGRIDATLLEDGRVQLTSNADLEAVNLAPLMQDLADSTYLSGLANLQLSVQGTGGSVEELKRSLSGDGHMDLSDGVLYGVDIAGTLSQLETMIRSRRLMSLQRGESTAFDEFTATLDIDDGVIRSDDLQLLAPGFRVDGQGILLDLTDNTLDYDLTTSVDPDTATTATEEYDIGGYSVPIACQGTLESPTCTPDIQAIVRRALGSEIERRVGDFLQQLNR